MNVFWNSSVAKRMQRRLLRTWTIVGLEADQFMLNCHRLLIFVKHAAASMKWVNAHGPVSVISCTWNPFPEIWEGNIMLQNRFTFNSVLNLIYSSLVYFLDISILVEVRAALAVAQSHHRVNDPESVAVPEAVIEKVATNQVVYHPISSRRQENHTTLFKPCTILLYRSIRIFALILVLKNKE